MFARLSGVFEAINADTGIMDVSGVGYLVQCSRKTLAQFGPAPVEATLLIETQVREDAIQLIGFLSAQEQQWFRLLTSVQGVGAKAGLAILSVCTPEDLNLAIAAGDKGMITRADGVGPKLATRLITELKDKVGSLTTTSQTLSVVSNEKQPVAAAVNEDAVSALVNLGYDRARAYAVIATLQNEGVEEISELIKSGLKALAA